MIKALEPSQEEWILLNILEEQQMVERLKKSNAITYTAR
jgi:hypothetical protein